MPQFPAKQALVRKKTSRIQRSACRAGAL